MKCEAYRDWILLEQSGELPAFRARRLSRHVAGCADCRAYRHDLLRVMEAAREPEAATAPAVLDRIRSTARREAGRSVEIRLRPSPLPATWRPALVYAALSVVALLGFWLVIRPALSPTAVPPSPALAAKAEYRWEDDLDTRIAEVQSLLASASTTDSAEPDDVNSIAEELLQLEEKI